ncbi:type I polyketide synthase [Leptolyngbya sp. 7M]|uniref:type I polyketide synthase n=1 Tax=Leptolyngbya sp. 7M TaxID=2812896 RepID=UPI001CEC7B24|nr:type I polyketide synthase [Leptolyngbya sp. 7M]
MQVCANERKASAATWSSLVAVHLACQSLHSGESSLALAGGVNLILAPEVTIVLSQAQMMASDGRCRTFDAAANGYVRGEGCGVIVLKRLTDAQRDGDRILALIRGSAINQDGRSNGLTAPNGLSQQSLLRQALGNAAVSPDQISYVELHGTGTALGDPIEAEALGAVLGQGRTTAQRCAVGSVKTNIGHLEAAAGIAGLIKVVLALQHRQLPPSLHFQSPNPYIPLDRLPLKVQQTLEEWTPDLRLAGVSSFGFGGTNAHVILQAAPTDANHRPTDTTATHPATNLTYLLPLSARSPEALRSLAQFYQTFLTTHAEVNFEQICCTASTKRSHHDYRLALVCRDRDQACTQLQAFLAAESSSGLATGQRQRNYRPRLVFVCSGQGSQWLGMGRQLWQWPISQDVLQQCDQLLQAHTNQSLLALLQREDPDWLHNTAQVQPALFALQVALAALWRSWGIQPDAVVGHSLGEVTAACVAGALSLEDGVQIVIHRSRLMQQASGRGSMAAVELSVAEAESLIAPYPHRLEIAAINSPTSLVLSGDREPLTAVLRQLNDRQIFYRMLPVDCAFHSFQMQPFQEQLIQALQGICPRKSSISMISTVTGKPITGEALTPEYWAKNMREPVNFAATMNTLAKSKYNTFIEINTHSILTTNIYQCLQHISYPLTIISSLQKQKDEQHSLLVSLGKLYTSGYPVQWQCIYPAKQPMVDLPTYPWQRQRYWLNQTASIKRTERRIQSVTSEARLTNADENIIASTFEPADWRITRQQLLATATADRQPALETYLSHLLSQVLGIASSQLDPEQPLVSLGLDSIVGMELVNRIQADLEVKVPLDYFAGLTISQFVTQVLLLVEKTEQPIEKSKEKKVNPEPGSAASKSVWIHHLQPNSQAALRLFCLPYAGAGASLFRAWQEHVSSSIELCPIQLPGREERLGEPPVTRLPALVEQLVPQLQPYLDKPFAVFGHSLGALIGFELTRELRRQNHPLPVCLFVSGCRAPQIPDFTRPVHRLPDQQFVAALKQYNGLSDDLLQHPEVLQFFLPILRADFAIWETYFYKTENPLSMPILAFGGETDPKVSRTELEAWQTQTQTQFSSIFLPGDHFFIRQHIATIAVNVTKAIYEAVRTQLRVGGCASEPPTPCRSNRAAAHSHHQ